MDREKTGYIHQSRGMVKTSLFTAFIFFMSIYFLPSLSAITLGDIKPDNGSKTAVEEKVPAGEKSGLRNDLPQGTPTVPQEDDINPRLVCLLSVIMPGGGHFYLNQDAKGLSFCIAAGMGYTATGYFLIKSTFSDMGSREYKNYLLMTGFLFFMTLIIHFVAIVEAYSDADELNKKNLFGKDKESDNPYITKVIFE